MNENRHLPDILTRLAFHDILHIDVALEGDWNPTVITVWSREKGFVGFTHIVRSHPRLIPSLELYFPDYWIGIHCFQHIDGVNVFDEDLAMRIIEYVSKIEALRRQKAE